MCFVLVAIHFNHFENTCGDEDGGLVPDCGNVAAINLYGLTIVKPFHPNGDPSNLEGSGGDGFEVFLFMQRARA